MLSPWTFIADDDVPDPRATPLIIPAERKEIAKEAVESGNHSHCYRCDIGLVHTIKDEVLPSQYGRGLAPAVQRAYRGHKGLFVLSLCVNCARYTFVTER